MKNSNKISIIATMVVVTVFLFLWQPMPPSATQDSTSTQTDRAILVQATKPPAAAQVIPPHATTISQNSIAYARSIGGTSHKGNTLYFIIGASVESEEEAQSKLDKAIPIFGDMQSYFIVQKSDNLEGMRPGWWVIVEAYKAKPSQENLDLAKRAFPDASIRKAIVRTSDPIPIYEELIDR